jgi:hypothetical protein
VFTVQQRNRVRIAIAFGFDRFLWRHKHYLPHCPGDTGRWAAHRCPPLSSLVVIHSLYRPILSRGTGKTLQGPRTIAYDPGLPDNSPLLDDSLGRSYLVGKHVQ